MILTLVGAINYYNMLTVKTINLTTFLQQWTLTDVCSVVYISLPGSFFNASLHWILSFSVNLLGNKLLQIRKYICVFTWPSWFGMAGK